MKSIRMAMNIRRISYILKKTGLITEQSKRIMEEAAANVSSSPETNWELVIQPENSIKFVKSESDDRVKPDIFCEIVASDSKDYPLSHLRLVLRVWSIQQNVSYRPEWDSNQILEKLEASYSYDRVISRCHYDTCTKTQYAPYYHFQFHGTPGDDELYWFPYTIELPHFPSPPIDLILAIEIVVATFFPKTHQRLLQDGTWVNIIKESELFLLNKYFERCTSYLETNPRYVTLLDRLCKQPA